MRIRIIAFGSRGDVQPIIALGKALRVRGHDVRVIASAGFGPWLARHGLDTAPASVDVQAVMMSEGGHDWVERGNSQIRQMRAIKKLLRQHGLAMMRDAWRGCEDAEVVVSSFTSDVYAASIAEKLNARRVSTPLQPALVATRSGAATTWAPLPTRTSLLNYACGKWFIEPFGWRLGGALNNRFRQETLGLRPQTFDDNRQSLRRTLIVQGYSALVVPHPPDWPANIHTTGYWFLDDDPAWQPTRALSSFLEAGDPPVYIGFGSMTGRHPEALTALIVDAVVRSGRRAILQSGWAGMGETGLPAQVFLLDSAPHRWLFPRMSATVHHGGAGTTAESLRAGLPTIVVPHLGDQPFWGSRVAALGVGPRPIPRNRLTAAGLAATIAQATYDPLMRERAATLGAAIRGEDGIGAAVDKIERFLASRA